ncbi:MAG TPA: ribosome maturation factor RimP [Candidatus Polarisedimenticolaceae bacterium]
MARDELQTRLESMAAQAASTRGVEVVEVLLRRQGRHSVLRIDIDRPGTPGVTLEDCEAVSHTLDTLLEADDPFGDVPYDLQVSSPGLDRPIRNPEDVRRNLGRRVVVNTRVPVDGRRAFKGVLAGGDAAGFRVLRDDGVEVGVTFEVVELAHQDLDLPPTPRRGKR